MTRGIFIGPRGERIFNESSYDNRPFSGKGGLSRVYASRKKSEKAKKARRTGKDSPNLPL